MFAVLGSVRAASSSVFISRIGVREIILRFPSRCIEEHLGKLVAFEMLFCYLGNFFNGIRVVWVICIAGGLKTEFKNVLEVIWYAHPEEGLVMAITECLVDNQRFGHCHIISIIPEPCSKGFHWLSFVFLDKPNQIKWMVIIIFLVCIIIVGEFSLKLFPTWSMERA